MGEKKTERKVSRHSGGGYARKQADTEGVDAGGEGGHTGGGVGVEGEKPKAGYRYPSMAGKRLGKN